MDTPSYVTATAASVDAAIKASGHSRVAVSNATGIPRTTLLRRLDGVSSFTLAEIAAIAAFLDMRASALIDTQVSA